MGIAIASSIVMAIAVVLVSWALISLYAACSDLPFKECFTVKMLHSWASIVKDSFSLPFVLIAVCIMSILMLPTAIDAQKRVQAKENGECVCQCQACKNAVRKAEAAVKYLALSNEDIDDLLKDDKKED